MRLRDPGRMTSGQEVNSSWIAAGIPPPVIRDPAP